MWHKIVIEEIISDLPDIEEIVFKRDFENDDYDLFIQAIGFESRTKAIAEKLSKVNGFTVKESLLIKYKANSEDNLVYESEILNYVKLFSKKKSLINVDEDVTYNFRQRLESTSELQKVIIDLSSLTSQLILSLLKILIHSKVELTIVYTEGMYYHPTEEEYLDLIDDDNSGLYQTDGIDNVIISPDYSGSTRENQDVVICFPSFKLERTEAVITYIDETILRQNVRERIVWVIGDPHMNDSERYKRMEIQKKINKVRSEEKLYEVCTLDYKKTLITLEHIYEEISPNYHINISDLGSKMQSVGIAFFANLRRDVSVYYSEPKKYNSTHYAEGIKKYWKIKVGNTVKFLEKLYSVDLLK